MRCYIGMGSNLGERLQHLRCAVAALEHRLGGVRRTSSVYRSSAWPDPAAPEYLNAVLELESELAPPRLLAELLSIELSHGRKRRDDDRYAARTIDLDLLLCASLVHHSDSLQLPHPRLEERVFVLVPLCELDPDLLHPLSQLSVAALLRRCADRQKAQLVHPPTALLHAHALPSPST